MKKICFLLCICSSFSLHAAPGLWQAARLSAIEWAPMENADSELEPIDIYNEKDVSYKDYIAYLSNGYTAALLSEQGLLLCPYEAVQAYLPASIDVQQGFYTEDTYHEIPLPHLQALFLERTEDISDSVRMEVSDSLTQDLQIQLARAIALQYCRQKTRQSGKRVYLCGDGRQQFDLQYFLAFADLRLVYLPPAPLAKSGTMESWLNRRHGLQMALIRIYSDRDNQAAAYSEFNRPWKAPQKGLKLAWRTPEDGDPIFALGYPWEMKRQWLSAHLHENLYVIQQVEHEVDQIYANRLGYPTRPSTAEEAQIAHWLNVLQIEKKKQQEELDFTYYAANHTDFDRVLRHTNAAPLSDSLYQRRASTSLSMQYLISVMQHDSLLRVMDMMMELNDENQREIYQELSHFYERYQPAKAQQSLCLSLNLLNQHCDSIYRPAIFQVVNKQYKGDLNRYVEKMFAKSLLMDEKRFNKYLDKPDTQQWDADPVVQLLRDLREKRATATQEYRRQGKEIQRWADRYTEGKAWWKPDSCTQDEKPFSLYVSVGKICSYELDDAIDVQPNSTVEGVLRQLNKQAFYFDFVNSLSAEERNLPVQFIHDCDFPPQHAGAALFNIHGELIGLLVDGNDEAYTKPYGYHPLQRGLGASVHYLQLLLEKQAGATRICQELVWADPEAEVEIHYLESQRLKPDSNLFVTSVTTDTLNNTMIAILPDTPMVPLVPPTTAAVPLVADSTMAPPTKYKTQLPVDSILVPRDSLRVAPTVPDSLVHPQDTEAVLRESQRLRQERKVEVPEEDPDEYYENYR